MASIYKSLVSVSIWILFVAGCVGIVVGILDRGRGATFAYGTFTIMLSVVAVWFRKKLD